MNFDHRMILWGIMALALSMTFSSCGSSESSKSAKRSLSMPSGYLPDEGTAELLKLINDGRKRRHLTVDRRLTLAAKDHSNSMYRHNYFAHKGRDGTNFQKRMWRYGYPLSHSSENLAKVPNAAWAYKLWLKSSGHRKNMFNKKYRRVGIARTGNYWTAVFAAPDGT